MNERTLAHDILTKEREERAEHDAEFSLQVGGAIIQIEEALEDKRLSPYSRECLLSALEHLDCALRSHRNDP